MAAVGASRTLTEDEQALLGSLLDASEKVRSVARALGGFGSDGQHASELVGLAERIGADACRLAGVTLESSQEGCEYGLVQLEIERHTDRLWTGHATTRGEKAVGHYFDAPTRSVALAMTLVVLARTLLDCAPDDTGGERRLERLLEEALSLYDGDDGPELSCHGEHVD